MKSTAGLGMALAGYALFAAGDGVVKSIAPDWPGTGIATLRYAFGAILLAVVLWMREGKAGFSCPKPGYQWGRALAVSLSISSFFVGLTWIPLAEATAINFAQPVIVALLSVMLLKERTSPGLWIAIALAFLGMVIMLRPNLAETGIAGVLPFVSACGMAALVMLNRAVQGQGSNLQMQFLISLLAVPILIMLTLAGHISGLAELRLDWPQPKVLALCGLLAVSASLAHMLIYGGTERATAAQIAPMSYVQLLVAMVIGWFAFGERFNAAAIGGAALVVIGGLILLRDQRNRHS